MVYPVATSIPAKTPAGGVQTGRRGAPRLRLSIPARVISLYDRRRCILIDLSETGAQIGLEKPLADGEEVVLEVGGLEPFGEVVRCAVGPNGGTNGISFDPPITKQQVLRIRAFAESYQEDELRSLRNEVRRWVLGS